MEHEVNQKEQFWDTKYIFKRLGETLILFFLLWSCSNSDLDFDKLIEDLRSTDFNTQINAAESLTGKGIQDSRFIEKIITVLKEVKQPKAKIAVTQALINIGTPAVGPLIRVLEDNSQDILTRYAVAYALGKIGDEKAIPPLIESLGERSDVQISATVALIDFGKSAIDPLVDKLKVGNSEHRERAAWILVKIGDPRARLPLQDALNKEDLPTIMGAYRFYIAMAAKKSESILIRALDEQNLERTLMAEEFIKCGNSRLQEAAVKWAEKIGYKFKNHGETILWGSGGEYALGIK